MAQLSAAAPATAAAALPPARAKFALIALTSLFFMWGFITCLNDILIPHLKQVFDLNYTQAMLVQFCFFGAYFVVSVPAGALVQRVGFQKGMVLGLIIAALGCALFYPAAALRVYAVFLFALFVLASGITILQVAANPYVTVLGPPATASSRLTLTQAFNSLGTTIAPLFGAVLIITEPGASPAAEASAVQGPYLMLAAILAILGVVFWKLSLPVIFEKAGAAVGSPLAHRHLVMGAVGIFVYVGAEVAIGSLMVNYIAEPNIKGWSEDLAAKYLAYYWGGAMVGRFIGAAVMQRIAAPKVLAFNAAMAAGLVIVGIVAEGGVAMWALLAVGLFNSIMFPTIFSLALAGLGPLTSRGSGILCLAIVGGAIVPLLQGALADNVSLKLSYVVPFACYLFIVFYGLVGYRPRAVPAVAG